MAVPVRGLKHIRTLAGRADVRARPYRGFMQITCLEMEKSRRNSERNSAAARIRDIDARLGEIEREQHALLEAVVPGAVKGAGIKSSLAASSLDRTPPTRRTGSAFRIRY